jgi:hypothetical protein
MAIQKNILSYTLFSETLKINFQHIIYLINPFISKITYKFDFSEYNSNFGTLQYQIPTNYSTISKIILLDGNCLEYLSEEDKKEVSDSAVKNNPLAF